MAGIGRPKKYNDSHLAALRDIVAEQPVATLAEVADELARRTGVRLSEPTAKAALQEAGVQRLRGRPQPEARDKSASAGERGSQRYGYDRRHRNQQPEQRYPSSLTDAEWALVADIFTNETGRGTAPYDPQRLIVDAC